ncbi:MAG TPA: tetraacyldisaccharide 4'-kinase [Chryseosolibacter sp.]
MKVASAILFPFAVVYDAVTSVRNRLYDLSIRPSASFDIPVISVGNLAVGGTGKTPMVEHLIRLLGSSRNVATLSRGYKRKTKGFRIAGAGDSAETIGDEPFQFYSKFRHNVKVTVGEERALAITNILQEFPEVDTIILDDAFQHRRVKPTFQILLTVYGNLFFDDWLLPAGRLRESKAGAKRADVVVVTKCPEHLSEDEMIAIESKIHNYTGKPVFFTTIHYGAPEPFGKTNAPADNKVVLVTGLSNANSLKQYVEQNFKLVQHFEYSDHHYYTTGEVDQIAALAKREGAYVITSEKDAAKLKGKPFESHLGDVAWFYIPIEIGFLKSGEDFDAMVLNAVAHA